MQFFWRSKGFSDNPIRSWFFLSWASGKVDAFSLNISFICKSILWYTSQSDTLPVRHAFLYIFLLVWEGFTRTLFQKSLSRLYFGFREDMNLSVRGYCHLLYTLINLSSSCTELIRIIWAGTFSWDCSLACFSTSSLFIFTTERTWCVHLWPVNGCYFRNYWSELAYTEPISVWDGW